MEEARVAAGVGAFGRGVIGHRRVAEEAGEHRANPIGGVGQAGRLCSRAQAVDQPRCEALQVVVHARLAQQTQRRHASGHGQWIARQRARLVDGPDGRDLLHDLAATAVCADRQTPADDLAQAGQIRCDAEAFLRPTQRNAKAGDDLVEDQERPLLACHGAQMLEESGLGRNHTHVARHGLDDHRRDLAWMGLEGVTHGRQVVVRHRHRLGSRRGGHTRRIGLTKRQRSRAGLNKQVVGMTVIATVELEDLVAPGEGSRQTQRAHGGFCARADEAHQVDAREGLLDNTRQVELGFGGGAVAGAAGRGLLDGGDHAGMRVTGDQRPPGCQVIDVAVVVDVPDGGAFGTRDEAWCAADGAEGSHGRVDAAREQALRLGKQRSGARGGGSDTFGHQPTAVSSLLRAALLSQRATSLAE